MEMGRINGAATGYGRNTQEDTMAILNDCTAIHREIDVIDENLSRLRTLQQDSLKAANVSQNTDTNRELDVLGTKTMDTYRNLVQRLKKVKSTPGAGSATNNAQVGRVDRRLRSAIQAYQTMDAEYRKELREQIARQYRIVNPAATVEQVNAVVDDPSNTQIFSQAVGLVR